MCNSGNIRVFKAKCAYNFLKKAKHSSKHRKMKMIDSEKSNNNKKQEEILEIPKNERGNVLRFFD